MVRVSYEDHSDLKIITANISKKLGRRYPQNSFIGDVLKIKDIQNQVLKIIKNTQ